MTRAEKSKLSSNVAMYEVLYEKASNDADSVEYEKALSRYVTAKYLYTELTGIEWK